SSDVSIGKTPGSDSMRVTGDFTQGSEGVLHVATDFVGKTADLLQVDGNVSLDGKVHIVAQSLMPDRELTFLQAGTITPSATVHGESTLFTYRTRQVDDSLAVSVDTARF